MKITVEISDDVMRAIKIKAAKEGYKINDLITILLKSSLASPANAASVLQKGDLTFPLIQCNPNAPVATMSAQDINILIHQTLDKDDLANKSILIY